MPDAPDALRSDRLQPLEEAHAGAERTHPRPLRVVALSGGVGGARFLRGLLHHGRRAGLDLDVTVVANTADDITLHGLRVCPDLDTVMYTLGDAVHEGQGWGRREETFTIAEELRGYGADVAWFTLGDRDLATHLLRTQLLGSGMPLSEVTARLCERWRPGARLLPMTDAAVETHVETRLDGVPVTLHFQEWWVRHHAVPPVERFVVAGAGEARPAPGVLEAFADADIVLLPPSNPVVSIGTILQIPGVAAALQATPAPIVGISPIVGGAPVRGMADACLRALGVATSAEAVAGLYADLLDGWIVAEEDAPAGSLLAGSWTRPRAGFGLRVLARPLLMVDVEAAADIAGAALELAASLSRPSDRPLDLPSAQSAWDAAAPSTPSDPA